MTGWKRYNTNVDNKKNKPSVFPCSGTADTFPPEFSEIVLICAGGV